MLRTISLNDNADVAGPFSRPAVRYYPKEKWLLLWGSYVVEKYEPKIA